MTRNRVEVPQGGGERKCDNNYLDCLLPICCRCQSKYEYLRIGARKTGKKNFIQRRNMLCNLKTCTFLIRNVITEEDLCLV
jgi:hypothetical protein